MPTDFIDAAEGLRIEVRVDGLRSRQGVLMVMLNDDAEKFPAAAKRTVIVPIDGESVTVQFRHLKAGTFAITALHDLDEDTKFGAGEGFAASNDAPGPPSFAASALTIDRNVSVTIAMRYP